MTSAEIKKLKREFFKKYPEISESECVWSRAKNKWVKKHNEYTSKEIWDWFKEWL